MSVRATSEPHSTLGTLKVGTKSVSIGTDQSITLLAPKKPESTEAHWVEDGNSSAIAWNPMRNGYFHAEFIHDSGVPTSQVDISNMFLSAGGTVQISHKDRDIPRDTEQTESKTFGSVTFDGRDMQVTSTHDIGAQ